MNKQKETALLMAEGSEICGKINQAMTELKFYQSLVGMGVENKLFLEIEKRRSLLHFIIEQGEGRHKDIVKEFNKFIRKKSAKMKMKNKKFEGGEK